MFHCNVRPILTHGLLIFTKSTTDSSFQYSTHICWICKRRKVSRKKRREAGRLCGRQKGRKIEREKEEEEVFLIQEKDNPINISGFSIGNKNLQLFCLRKKNEQIYFLQQVVLSFFNFQFFLQTKKVKQYLSVLLPAG